MSKKQPKLTPWFSARVKPVHTGVYETKSSVLDDSPDFQHWNGSAWGCVSSSPADAYGRERIEGYFQSVKWRGLAVKP